MTERITKKDLSGMLERVRRNTGLNVKIGLAYGNHYTLELNSTAHTGCSDVVHAFGIRDMYEKLNAIARVIEAMRIAKPDEMIAVHEA